MSQSLAVEKYPRRIDSWYPLVENRDEWGSVDVN
jgi:hypothetical protein